MGVTFNHNAEIMVIPDPKKNGPKRIPMEWAVANLIRRSTKQQIGIYTRKDGCSLLVILLWTPVMEPSIMERYTNRIKLIWG